VGVTGSINIAAKEMKRHVQNFLTTLRRRAVILMSILSTLVSIFGCSPSQPAEIKVEPVTNDADHDQYFKAGSGLIEPYMRLLGVPEKSTSSNKAKIDITRGIALLDAVIAYNTNNWAAWWMMGKGYQALDNHEKACDAFGKSYAIQRNNPDVAREYMNECLDLGRTTEAISAAEYAVGLSPNDAGLHANLALAYTLAGRISDTQSAINKSLGIDPNDKISLTLRQVVQEIAEGKRKQPRTMRELERR
jgi:tetratricopeptide (TPR) repeat protein